MINNLVERLRDYYTPEGRAMHSICDEAADEIERLWAERDALKTVMIAAAEEIAAHWDAHCDAEGYGPQNLLRRLEEGIPSEYGYTAGAFAELKAERDALIRKLRIAEIKLRERAHPATDPRDSPEVLASTGFWPECGCDACYAIHCLRDALDERDALRADAKQRLTALRVAYGALLQCSPCAEPECKVVQMDWLETAISSINAAIEAAMAQKE